MEVNFPFPTAAPLIFPLQPPQHLPRKCAVWLFGGILQWHLEKLFSPISAFFLRRAPWGSNQKAGQSGLNPEGKTGKAFNFRV
jgi:hypothetical protein